MRVCVFAVLAAIVFLSGCGPSSSVPNASGLTPLTSTHQALVIGSAAGAMYSAIAQQYNVSSGTGSEDPAKYDMVVFDGNTTTPGALQSNAAPGKFLRAGKMVVLVNSTEALRDSLKGVLWMHAQGSFAASAFFMVRNANGTPIREVEIVPTVHLQPAPNGCVPSDTTCGTTALISPTFAQLTADASSWLAKIQRMWGIAVSQGGGNIGPPSTTDGQTVLNYDLIQTAQFTVENYLNTYVPGESGLYGNLSGYWCPGPSTSQCTTTTYTPVFINTISVDYESSVSALLISNSNGYQQKIILRQYGLDSPIQPNSSWIQDYFLEWVDVGGNYEIRDMGTTLGFNLSTWLRVSPPAGMAITQALPANANNVTQLTTSNSDTQSVGLSATAGYDGAGVGTLDANWSDSWSWSQSSTVNISDWSATQSGSPSVTYVYEATGGTPDTYDALTTYYLWAYPNGSSNNMRTGVQNLNALEAGNQVSQSETDWLTTGSLLAPTDQTVSSSFQFVQGEVFGYQTCDHTAFTNCSPDNFSNSPSATYNQPIVIDFSNPTLQPPAAAPWALSFSPWPQTVPTNAQITGTVQLTNGAMSTPVTILLSYVVQPQSTVSTLPSNEACPGNQYQFNAGPNVVSDGQPPLSVTIPAGQTSVTFPLSVQTFNGNNYNVQVVAWLPTFTSGATTYTNPQSAWCLTVPNTTIGQSFRRRHR